MNGLTFLFVLLGIVLILFAVQVVIYTFVKHKGVVVGRVDRGAIVKLKSNGRIVFAADIINVIGDEVEVVHPAYYKLFPKGYFLADTHTLRGGYVSPDGERSAILVNHLEASRWLAKDEQETGLVFIELDNDDYKVGDSVNYKSSEIVLNQFYIL